MIWRCPIHRGPLIEDSATLRAECCGRSFPVIEGIPDLRLPADTWLDFATDLEAARSLSRDIPADDIVGSIRAVFARRPGWSAARVDSRTTMTLALADRMREEWGGWLTPAHHHAGPLLDLGCGAGSLLSVAPPHFERIGIDVSMEWLVVAKRIAAVAGAPVQLAAALAEALPLPAESIGVLTALDVMEHVADQPAMVREVDRVLQPAGIFCAATPNRFSIASEPHVGIWGVGWLPRSMQADYVRWRANLPYDFTRLLSHGEIVRIFRRNASFVPQVEPAPIPRVERARFGRRRRWLAKGYNALLAHAPFRSAARKVGAFFHIRGVKPGIARMTTLAVTLFELLLPELVVVLA